MSHGTSIRRTNRAAVRAAIVSGAALAAAALFGATANADTPEHSPGGTHAVFVQTDNVAGNAIVAYRRSVDGTLHPTATYPTGGFGGVLDGSVVDHLASQGSLTYDDGLLYAVNAGSDTVTAFHVSGDRLTGRQVLSSGGDFPVSIAAHGALVYVLNARDGGSIQGYLRVGARLVRVPAWHRDLGLDPNQTPEFTSTPGQVAFTPDGSKLIVTTKANGNAIKVFTVSPATGPSASPTTTVLDGDVPFAVTFDRQGHLVAALAGPNALATFRVNNDGTLTAVSTVPTGQAATCWVVPDGDRFYVSNAGSATLSAFRDNPAGALTALGNTSTDPGTVDAALSADARFLYVQTGANGIVDEYHVRSDGTLTEIGSVAVPGAAGGEGIVAR
jgi:6-phosphogluconolactonase (cycloisomerase 2 family)